jgi:hypothetical protein
LRHALVSPKASLNLTDRRSPAPLSAGFLFCPTVGDGVSMRCLAIVGLLVLLCTQGCTRKPELPITAYRSDYPIWNCRQLAEEADLLKDAIAVASDPNVLTHLNAETEAVRKVRKAKKCIV